MADTAATAAATAADAPAAKGKSKIKIIAIVGAIVAIQCVLAYLYLPGGDSSAKSDAKKEAAAKAGADADAGEGKSDTREVDLGKFSLTAFDPNSNTTLLIDFHLYGTVLADRAEKGAPAPKEEAKGGKGKEGGGPEEDNSTFGRLFRKNKNRFRDSVIVIIRNAQMADLADPGLGLIKRQILAKTNSLIGEPLLKEIVFSDFAVVQQ